MTRDRTGTQHPHPRSKIFRVLASRRLSPWLAVDSFAWTVMYGCALWLRFDFDTTRSLEALEGFRFTTVLFGTLVLSAVLGVISGLYRGRFIPGSLIEASWLSIVVAGASTTVFLILMSSPSVQAFPRGLPLMAGAFTLLVSLTLRSFVRGRRLLGSGALAEAERVIVFGAGDGGRHLVKQLRQSVNSTYNPVAFLDDDPAKQGMVIEGVKVRGTRERLERIASQEAVSTFVIAAPSLSPEDLIEIRDRAERAGLHVLILPPIGELMKSRPAADELRQINVNDLLGRKPARLNQSQIAEYLRGKRILVTGAGGSIGSELCRQLMRFRPSELIMLDRDESGLHATQLSIQNQSMLDGDDTILASIRDGETVDRLFAERRPQIVFHAAALKHMPLLEHYPLEAVKTNVLGTKNLLDAAAKSGVETFVNISTDKAANPSNVLGFSKRIAERLTASAAERAGQGKYVSVRFGNVLGSRGSVLTVFERQIAEGGPLTVTDPDVRRFFMTIPEACQLVLQAAVIGQSGETLVLDMGEPVAIIDVARTLIEQSGKDIGIVYTGLRENEKIDEELFDRRDLVSDQRAHPAITHARVAPFEIDLAEVELVLGDAGASRRWLADKSG
ncbi:nucleoside-diphosphate sugar epimerase/dehydratase [Dietzia sp. CH92]|uniref:polysaccharide biosynthesis protein n=1 Tax=Dietzia sp. CH92 TaxID=3051823 RepID=UPI0028D17E21|nr:nucleoside-diphosphate sugar epimerase/dehydratase [Dietzia sp. CH92]